MILVTGGTGLVGAHLLYELTRFRASGKSASQAAKQHRMGSENLFVLYS